MQEMAEGKQKGLDLFASILKQEDVSVVFHTNKKSFEPIASFSQVSLIHEQAAVHAADGYSRSTGKAGVAMIMSEYGLTNAVTSMGTAQLDSVPLVIFVQHPSNDIEYQLGVEEITKGVTKHNLSAHSMEELMTAAGKAFHIAVSDRPGVVVVDYPECILQDMVEPFDTHARHHKIRPTKEVSMHKIDAIVEAMNEAEQPILLVGGGTVISGAGKELHTFLEETGMPYASTLMGLGALEVDHPLHLGMVGMHGTFAANRAVHQADLLICLGVRFSDRITGRIKGFSPHSKKIQIDIDPAEVNKRVIVDYPVIGDVKHVLKKINERVLSAADPEWRESVKSWSKKSAQFHEPKHNLIGPDFIIRTLNQHANQDALIATDVGQHQMWTAHHYCFKRPRRFLTSGGFGTMGYGLPAAIGGAVSSPHQQVVCVSGDGSIQMNIQELMTAVRYQLDIKIAIMKNGYLGMVRQWQQLFYKRNYSHVKISSPDYAILAESYGAVGLRAETQEQAEAIIAQAFRTQGPVVMEFTIEEEENVYPIVPPGGNNTDALDDGRR
ncbi:biosynthetic-type acetolactate synthase large subunit [Virgibacillus xinjiangensis]|uniref:Acetolactate synthase n=1 Tax=Virgibacillus xinjiangensis TaxID=393090 RepID=A0ABV7CYK5_9BACI